VANLTAGKRRIAVRKTTLLGIEVPYLKVGQAFKTSGTTVTEAEIIGFA
jgi:hypothetical protein